MIRLRRLHNLIGVFFAPAILFFAFTGALQTLGLHEHRGPGPYQPPAWIVTIASVHKDQVLPKPRPEHKEQGPPVATGPGHHDHDDDDHDKGPSPWPLKLFVLALAASLSTSAITGVWIALRSPLTRRTSLVLLAAGAVVPVTLLFL